jgi:hypothetical protein
MGAVDRIKSFGLGIGSLIIMLFMVAIPIIILFGMARVSMSIYPWLMPVFFLTLAICVFPLGPLALLTKTRGFAASAYLLSSYVFGAILWIWALLLTFDLWGMFAVIIGILFLGIGIIPVALLAVIFHAEWSSLGDLTIMIVVTFGFRIFAVWLGEKAKRESQSVYE